MFKNNQLGKFLALIAVAVMTITPILTISSSAKGNEKNDVQNLTLEKIENVAQNDKSITIKFHTKHKKSGVKAIKEISFNNEQIEAMKFTLEKEEIKPEVQTSGFASLATKAWALIKQFWTWLWPIILRGYDAVVNTCWGNQWLARALGLYSCWDFGKAIMCAVFGWWCD